MIPVSLTLKGMYSYQKEQIIDFTSLTSNHLFGIFGPVGSGKSTILEAITFALYGETERLNTRDNRGYNMMNLKSSELMIDFVCKAGKNNMELFRWTVKGMRDKKSFENIKPYERRAFKLVNKSWMPIEDATADNIIGLSYDNFRRTIIIPQGKFQEFLQLGDADRTRMLKEIFNLDKYDLYTKTEKIETENTIVLEGVKGQLQQVGEVNQSLIDEESKHLETVSNERMKVNAALQEQQQKEAEFKKLKEIQDKIDKQREEVIILGNQIPKYDQRAAMLDQYELCQKQFPDMIRRKHEIEKETTAAVKRVELTQKDLNETVAMAETMEKEFRDVEPQYENRNKLEAQWKEYELAGQLRGMDEELKSISKDESKKTDAIALLNKSIERQKKERASVDRAVKQLKKSLPDETILFDMKRWFDRSSTLKERIEELQSNAAEEKKSLAEYQAQKNDLLKSMVLADYLKPSNKKLQVGEIVEILNAAVKNCRILIKEKEKDIELLRDTQVLETFASELKDGQPCVLCGAEHHPAVYTGKGVKSKIQLLTREKDKLEADVEKLQSVIVELKECNTQLKNAQTSSAKLLKELDSKKQDYEDHEKLFKWNGYDVSDEKRVDREIRQSKEGKETIIKQETLREDLEENVANDETRYAAMKEELQSIARRQSEINGQRKILVNQIKMLDLKTVDTWTQQTLNKKIALLQKQYQQVEKRYKELQSQIHAYKDRQSTLRGTLKTEEESLAKIKLQRKTIEKELMQRMRAAKYTDVAEIEAILAMKLDDKAERQAIQVFRERVHSAREQLEKFIQEKGAAEYMEEKHQIVKQHVEEYKRKLKEVDEVIGKVTDRIKTLEKNLKQKDTLEAKKRKLEARSDNLIILKRLFRGNKFVNYASRVYLENLCGLANLRFAQLTRQKLHLELSEDNSFKVRDFLNDGKVRSVKTLSGGQTFQASLSLALALADNVQRFAHVNENFFFLDEGFGTLDKDALKTVFDALKSLRQENRIVGVISHVEELQHEIDNFVKVSLNPEIGSIIELS